MTTEPLNTEAIRARVDAATPGTWQTMSPRADGRNAVQRPHYGLYGEELSEFLLIDTNPSDAEFIAHARTDIPALLDENATLRAQLADATETVGWQLYRTEQRRANDLEAIAQKVSETLDKYNEMDEDEDGEQCAPEDRWRLYRDLRAVLATRTQGPLAEGHE